MAKTNIEWADAVWNPVVGCNKVSAGCANCYAEAVQRRFTPKGSPAPLPWLPGNATVALKPERLGEPATWKKGQVIFVCSMSDLFNEQVPDWYIEEVFNQMYAAACECHTFLLLTKRPERVAAIADKLVWYPNIWLGTSVESQYWANRRIPALAQVPAAVRFLSCEPLLRAVDLSLPLQDGLLQWVIAGGESGPKARPMNPDWVRVIRDDCAQADVPFFFKQWGGRTSKANGRTLDGVEHSGFPDRVNAQLCWCGDSIDQGDGNPGSGLCFTCNSLAGDIPPHLHGDRLRWFRPSKEVVAV